MSEPADRSWMTEAHRVFREAEDRLDGLLLMGDGAGWFKAWEFAAKTLGMASETLRLGAGLDFTLGRVRALAGDPRRFELAERPDGEPALIWALEPDMTDGPNMIGEPVDLVAVSLTRARFWRLTCRRTAVADEGARWRSEYRLWLRQDVREYARRLILWRDREARAAREGRHAYEMIMRAARLRLGAEDIGKPMGLPAEPERAAIFWEAFTAAREAKERAAQNYRDRHVSATPEGALILDPGAMNWTRRGWLKGVEDIEILDAPSTGALGRALRRLNPTIGGPRGAQLLGVEVRRAA